VSAKLEKGAPTKLHQLHQTRPTSILGKEFRAHGNVLRRHRQGVVVGRKSARPGIVGTLDIDHVVVRSMRRIDIVHVHDRVDRASHTGNEARLGLFEIRLDVGLQVDDAAFPNVAIPVGWWSYG
jgi:hypothetical protein